MPPQLELSAGWLHQAESAPKLDLPFQRSKEVDVARVARIFNGRR
jgi:hypothetical protein